MIKGRRVTSESIQGLMTTLKDANRRAKELMNNYSELTTREKSEVKSLRNLIREIHAICMVCSDDVAKAANIKAAYAAA